MIVKIENKNLIKAMDILGIAMVDELKNQLRINNKLASGSLDKSITYVIKDDKNKGVFINILANDYIINVDSGRKAGSRAPGSKRILPWLKERGITAENGETLEQIAFLISRSIGKDGIKATNIISKAKNIVMRKQLKNIATASKQDMIDMIKKMFIN